MSRSRSGSGSRSRPQAGADAGSGFGASGPDTRRGGGDGRRRTPALIAGRALASLLGLTVLVTTGFVWYINSLTDGITKSAAIGSIKPGEQGYVAPHLGNDVNLLLIGLDSRVDMNGNPLPTDFVEDELHAGKSGIGGYNTNVLIFMHIPANGGRVTAYSIPRDDYVERPGGSTGVPGVGTVPDLGKGKIKEAYNDAHDYAQRKLRAAGVTNQVELESKSREVGREATIRAVQLLTGQPVDHFAEVNLKGFYDVVSAIGSIQVCLKAPANDPIENHAGTGLNLPAGLSTINAATALQFVRQRYHLQNGDLDRTHRQQAFLSSVTAKLRDDGVLSDLGKLTSLINVAKQDVVIDDKLDVLSFAQEASNLTGGNATFNTLPILRTADIPIGGGNTTSVNIVDPANLKSIVTAGFTAAVPPPPPATGTTPAPTTPPTTPAGPRVSITVLNGTSSNGLAQRVSLWLFGAGYPVDKTGDNANIPHTVIKFGSGAQAAAADLAAKLGVKATPQESGSVPANGVVIIVGKDFKLPAAPTPAGGSATTDGATTTDGSGGGLTNGGAVQADSQNGIPCVN